MTAPPQIKPERLGDYLEVLTKAAFQSGMSWKVIESKWPGFREAFFDFDAERVSELTPDDVDRLATDTRIVRNRKKIEATVFNAGEMCELEVGEEGGFAGWLSSRGDFEATVKALRKRFKFLGDFGAYYFLYVVGEPVPAHEEFRASRAEKRPARG